jgi:excisionase family DNA binding protein
MRALFRVAVMSALGRALLDELSPDDLTALAQLLAPFLPSPAAEDGGWLTTREAAEYAGCSVNALHRAMAAREVEFVQNCEGGKAHFKRSAIDTWRRGDGPINARSTSVG